MTFMMPAPGIIGGGGGGLGGPPSLRDMKFTNMGGTTGGTNNHVLPNNIVAGDHIFIHIFYSPNVSSSTSTANNGFTRIANTQAGGQGHDGELHHKVAAGTEGGITITHTGMPFVINTSIASVYVLPATSTMATLVAATGLAATQNHQGAIRNLTADKDGLTIMGYSNAQVPTDNSLNALLLNHNTGTVASKSTVIGYKNPTSLSGSTQLGFFYASSAIGHAFTVDFS